ncbi:MAG: NADPH:quinone oxidoreductase family protein [Frankiaceae bacterium]|nr:NADPH:quinone oxidoreductase family protein [Frankiaceae bacterium]
MRAIQITEFGGPEVLTVTDLPDPEPVDGFDLVEVTAAGVNFADTHQVEDSYLSKTELPLIPGSEVCGTTSDGRRVASLVGAGGYAEKALAFPAMTFDLPEGVTDAQALALMVQGLSAWHLLKTCTHLEAGESVVVHAAAGGVGTLAIQLAKMWGAGRVIGVASSAAKRQLAEELGADATVDAGADDLKAALIAANEGQPVDIVLEMVGGPTFDASLAALAPFGRLATFGMAGRVPPAPIDAGALMQRSRAVIGFWLMHCLNKPGMLAEPMAEMLGMVAAGQLSPVVGATYPLSDARRAHEDLRSRRSTGKLVLDPRS